MKQVKPLLHFCYNHGCNNPEKSLPCLNSRPEITMKTPNRLLFNILLLFVLVIFPRFAYVQVPIVLSEKWTGTGGEMAVFYQNVTKTDVNRNVYVAGSTINTSGNHDIVVQKFDKFGALIWQEAFDGAAEMNDMASDVFIDNVGNVYVTGGSAQDASDSSDLIVMMYDSTGSLQWTYYYNNDASPLPYDVGTGIVGNNSGSIYIVGGSYGNSTMSDYITIKLNSSTGAQVWASRYDYVGLQDVARRIRIQGANLIVSGASQSDDSPVTWELATLKYHSSSGVLINAKRSASSTSDGDEVTDLTVGADDKVYVTGAFLNDTTGYDLGVYKLSSSLVLEWYRTFDGYELEDKGHGVKVDAVGNVYVVGFVTSPTTGKNGVLLKYNSSGTLQWSSEIDGLASLDDELIQLVIDDAGRIFVTGEIRNSTNSDYQTFGFTPEGDIIGQIAFNGPDGLDDRPTEMAIDLDGHIVITGLCKSSGGQWRNQSVKYSVIEKPFNIVYVDDTIPSHSQGELLIRFDTSMVIRATIDKRQFQGGELSDFVKDEVIDSMDAKLGYECSRLSAFKVFTGLASTDTMSITRLDDTIRIDDLWAYLLVVFPQVYTEEETADSLRMVKYPLIQNVDLNYIAQSTTLPNDNLISTDQAGMVPTASYPDGSIGVENAWDIEVGDQHCKVGVYDGPIHWRHEDFGDGTWAGTKIVGGWDFIHNKHIKYVLKPGSWPYGSHGTAVAGIIGALRNNDKGISGIAGGNVDGTGNTGVQLFSLAILDGFGGNITTIDKAANAIVEGASYIPAIGYGYGLHIQNHSWGVKLGDEWLSPVLMDAVRTAWRNHCILVASRGNKGHIDNIVQYPACYDDLQIISVGASGINGERKVETGNGDEGPSHTPWASSYGFGMDLIAPGCTELVSSPYYDSAVFLFDNTLTLPGYYTFNGSSAGTPHVAGVAALMYSRHHSYHGAPNSLTTEDIEHILEKTADSDKGTSSGFDAETGWGLLNAEEALNAVNHPDLYVKHSSLASSSGTTVLVDEPIYLLTNMFGLANGTYIADLHHYTWTYIDVLPSTHEIIDFWPVDARTVKGVSSTTIPTGVRWMNAIPDITLGENTASYDVETYAWWVKSGVFKWIPENPVNFKFGYSLHVDNTLVGGEEDLEDSINVNLYPNPSNDIINITFSQTEAADVQMEIRDPQGKVVATHYLEKKSAGGQTLAINVANLPKGMYILRLTADGQTITRKFVRQ